MSKYIGSNFDDFLKEEGVLAEAEAIAGGTDMTLHEEIIEVFNEWDTQPDEWFTSEIIAKVEAKTIERVLAAVESRRRDTDSVMGWEFNAAIDEAITAIKGVGDE